MGVGGVGEDSTHRVWTRHWDRKDVSVGEQMGDPAEQQWGLYGRM
jgi:hypothetical protein